MNKIYTMAEIGCEGFPEKGDFVKIREGTVYSYNGHITRVRINNNDTNDARVLSDKTFTEEYYGAGATKAQYITIQKLYL